MPRAMPISMPKPLRKRILLDEIVTLQPFNPTSARNTILKKENEELLAEVEGQNPPPVKLFRGNFIATRPAIPNRNLLIFCMYHFLRISFVPFEIIPDPPEKPTLSLLTEKRASNRESIRGGAEPYPTPWIDEPPIPLEPFGDAPRNFDEVVEEEDSF